MTEVVDREAFLTSVRATRLAFTVTWLESSPTLSLCCSADLFTSPCVAAA
jgi:hypothetical protein